MDLLEVKNLIADALVESIFRRACYRIVRFTSAATPLRAQWEGLAPNFRVARKTRGGGTREFLVSVKYRPAITQRLSVAYTLYALLSGA